MKKWVGIILKIVAFVGAIYGVVLGIFYLKTTIPSDRELWRITDYTVSDPIVVNNSLIFSGYKADHSGDCYCLYAVDKSTREIIWSTEKLAEPYSGFVLISSISFSVYTNLEAVSETGDFIYVSLDYWGSDDSLEHVLFAIRSRDGQVLWKVDGQIDTDSFSNSISQMNQIFVLDNQGGMLAIDSITGKQLWRHVVYPNYDKDYVWFSYENNIVLVSIHSSECLECCCTFISDEQQYEQIAAFSAETGQPLWETDRLDSGRIDVSNDTLYIVSRPWEKSSDLDKRYDGLVTAINLETGIRRWDLIFEDAHELTFKENSQDETFFLIRTYEGGPNDFHKFAKLIVVDDVIGEPIWHFNQDFSHGNLGYLTNENFVYIGTEDGFIYLLDSTTGNVIWQTKTGDFPIHFVVEGNALIAVYETSYVSVLDAKTGLQKWKLDLGLDESWSALGDEILKNHSSTLFIAGNSDQKIYAIDIDTGKELWSWSHFRPTRSEYQFELFDSSVIYVSENPRWSFSVPDYFVRDWFFALETEP